jgi:hypothetical protein
MKIRMALIGFLFVLGAAYFDRADAQTNEQRLTNAFSISQNGVWDEIGDEQLSYWKWLYRGEIIPETLPANEDTNDLWGMETNGLQLSLRVFKPEYETGVPVPVVAVLRNLESYPQTLVVTNAPYFFLHYIVYLGTNQWLAGPKKRQVSLDFRHVSMPQASLFGYAELGLGARSEKIDELNLSRFIDLSQPGDYTVQAICRVYSSATKAPIFEVRSGTVSFKINKKPASP